jgi:glycolate dehydrogenase iron-sulfur subunit
VQTRIAESIKKTPQGREADAILRTCVHCGFCNATCPTYQLLGDELDGPRGRIYLIKQVLEGHTATARTQRHLDRCLTCRACETTCPSGVEYARLLDIGRAVVEQQVERPWLDRLRRRLLRMLLPYPRRLAPFVRMGQALQPLLPAAAQRKISPRQPHHSWPAGAHSRTMLMLDGCVQPLLAPNIDAAAAHMLDRLGIRPIQAAGSGCCGALSHHLSAQEEALRFMRRNIDAWWPHIERGAEAIVMTASGCGVMVKEYGRLLRHDADYAAKAAQVSALTRDIGEIVAEEDLARLGVADRPRIAFHSPCTLQHGQQLNGCVERILTDHGFQLTPIADSHLCCGSAGTYSLLQKELSMRLLKNKADALEAGRPDIVATANIGCLLHIQSATQLPVVHWIELLDHGSRMEAERQSM